MDIITNETALNRIKGLLGARRIKLKELNAGWFKLDNNSPIIVDSRENTYVLFFAEDAGNGESLCCNIVSYISDKAKAIIGKEIYLVNLSNKKRVDLSYYYFSENQDVTIYLYDVKRTFAGINTMLDLIAQWESSLNIFRTCLQDATGIFSLADSNIHFGVITKNNDTERRIRELTPILYPEEVPENLPSFIISKHAADMAENKRKALVLKGFDENRVMIDGIAFEYDVRTFDDNNIHKIKFNDGELQ